MVRCGANRSEMKYETECVNARDAINRLERAEEQARRQQLEAQSERKRQALRRTQEAAAAARRRAEDDRRRREEAEYLGLFEELPPQPGDVTDAQSAPQVDGGVAGNAPVAEVEPAPVEAETVDEQPEAQQEPVAAEESSDLGQIREELKRRQQTAEN